jgi:hypothetical protein
MNMQLVVVVVYVWRGKAYLPVQAQLESGPFMGIEPMFTAGLNTEELLSAVEKVLAAGHPRLPDLTREEMRQRKDPVLAATKVRSWKELARTGASYTIGWTDKEIRVDMSRLDKKGKWEFDPEKMRIFPPNTPLQDIIAVILEDIRSRPELMK